MRPSSWSVVNSLLITLILLNCCMNFVHLCVCVCACVGVLVCVCMCVCEGRGALLSLDLSSTCDRKIINLLLSSNVVVSNLLDQLWICIFGLFSFFLFFFVCFCPSFFSCYRKRSLDFSGEKIHVGALPVSVINVFLPCFSCCCECKQVLSIPWPMPLYNVVLIVDLLCSQAWYFYMSNEAGFRYKYIHIQ